MEVITTYPGLGLAIIYEDYKRTSCPTSAAEHFPWWRNSPQSIWLVFGKEMLEQLGFQIAWKWVTRSYVVGRRWRWRQWPAVGWRNRFMEERIWSIFLPENFNARKVIAYVCLPIIILTKCGSVPRSVLKLYEPIPFRRSGNPPAKHFCTWKISFTHLALY